MNQEEWGRTYLDKDKPYDFWEDPEHKLSIVKEDSNTTAGSFEDTYSNNRVGGFTDSYADTPYYVTREQIVENKQWTEHEHFPYVTIILVIANIIAGVLCYRAGTDHVLAGGTNYEYITKNHEFGRFISYMFLHANIEHLANNMISLFLFGNVVEKRLGSLRTAIIYFSSGIGAGIASTYISHLLNPERIRFCVGASGAVFGIICAYMFVDRMKEGMAKRKDMIGSIVIVVIFALISMQANVDIYGHIFGAIIGGVLAFVLNVKKWENYKEDTFKKLVGIILCLWLCIMGIGEANIGKAAKALPDKRIDFIKEQLVFADDGDITFGDVLDSYCTKTEWMAFTSESREDIVQFEGNTYYEGREHRLMIQFIVQEEEQSFTICYFAFDDEAQTGAIANDYFTGLYRKYQSEHL